MQYILGTLILIFGILGLTLPLNVDHFSRAALLPSVMLNAGVLLLGLAVLFKRPLESPIYAGSKKRIAASLLDWLIVSLLMVAHSYVDAYLPVWAFVPSYIVTFLSMPLLCIWCHSRFGMTPGKFLMKIKVVSEDFTPIGLRKGFLRSSVDFGLGVGIIVLGLETILRNYGHHQNLSYVDQEQAITQGASLGYFLAMGLNNLWFVAEAVSMMLNGKRRAIHDFIAGTVIVNATTPGIADQAGLENQSDSQEKCFDSGNLKFSA